MTIFDITKHALGRALEMQLDPEFIRDLLHFPDTKRWKEAGEHEACWMYRKGDVAAPVVPEEGRMTVLTFLPATTERWEKENLIPAPGRKFDRERWLHG